MLGFKRKYKLLESGILRGATDIHCHVLPGVDDGSPDIDTSFQLLEFMSARIGYSKVWLTPHVMRDLHNTAEKVSAVFSTLKENYSGSVELRLASEYMMDEGFKERLTTDPLRLGSEHLLVETSYMNPPVRLDDILMSVWEAGFRPLIAHPERYMYMGKKDYEHLKEYGFDFQLNIMSLSGYYGARPKAVAFKLLEQGMYDYVGSDLHHLDVYQPMMEKMKLTKSHLDALDELLANNNYI